jgi:uncharacterized SAM-binding protein YcdF (DUF218 family)
MARRSGRLVALIFVILVCVLGVIAFRGVGRWLICEDSLAPADVIVVLSGSMPARAEEAARLFRLGEAREVWVSQPEGPQEKLALMGIQYEGEDYFSREVLIHSGVPEADVRILPEPIVDTQQEVREVSDLLRQEGKTSAIVVTSPQHTRRVRRLWHNLVGRNPRAIVRAAYQDSFDANHWWHNTRDTFAVVREVMGLVNAWTGLRVSPHEK